MKYKRISDFPKSQAESISVLGVEDGHNVQMEVLSKNATLQNIQKGVANKANEDGNYPKMTAGFAQEIIGDGSATPEEFSFRPKAGEDRNVANTTYYDGERNGVARIEKIKGNSLVWNSKIRNELSTNNEGLDGWFVRQGQANAVIEGNTIKYTFAQLNGGSQIPQLSQYIGFTINHKYLIDWKYDYPDEVFTLESNNIIRFRSSDSKAGSKSTNIYEISKGSSPKGRWQKIWTCNVEGQPFIYTTLAKYENLNNIGLSASHTVKIFDLTKMFGAGNEPTTVEEFWQRLPKGIDISEYNEGTITDGDYGGIKTIGFNAYNGTYAKVCAGCPYYLGGNYTSLGFTTEEGGTTESIAIPTSAESVGTTPSDRLYTPLQNGYIYAEGENININISWGTEYGYLNGTYQPYKPFERDLSWVTKYFPNGMRSAGSVRDEIRFNSTTQKWEAVQNVGVTTIGELKWSIYGTLFCETLTNMAKPSQSNNVKGDLLCIPYVTDAFNNVVGEKTNKTIGIYSGSGIIRVYDTDYSDAASFKAANYNVQLYYALATPIVTEIDEIPNMDFDVSDYGTEELIVEKDKTSAPIVADISYAPNALSTIKQVPDILKRLKALESAVASATAITNEETVE